MPIFFEEPWFQSVGRVIIDLWIKYILKCASQEKEIDQGHLESAAQKKETRQFTFDQK